VQEQVFNLSNDNLKKLAQAHGLDPEAPEFAFGKGVKRSESTETSGGRHQTGRRALAEAVTNAMGDEEKINIGRGAEQLEHNPDMANKTKAQRAERLFPRLRGPVDQYGNPKVSGGAPEAMPRHPSEAQLIPNASGESSSSMEAINRLAGEKSRGTNYYRIDTRKNTAIPLVGPERVDAVAGPYEEIIRIERDGSETTLDKGDRARRMGKINLQ
jgi:hypothetical protein